MFVGGLEVSKAVLLLRALGKQAEWAGRNVSVPSLERDNAMPAWRCPALPAHAGAVPGRRAGDGCVCQQG